MIRGHLRRTQYLTPRPAALAFLTLVMMPPFAFAADSIPDQLQGLAEALQSGDTKAALSHFDPQAKDYSSLRRSIEALAQLPHTECEIEASAPVSGGDTASVESRWTLRLSPRENGPLVVRKASVNMLLRQIGGAWKISSLAPHSVLDRPTTAVFDVISGLASTLSASDAPGALSAFDSASAGYGRLSNDIDALSTQFDVLCAIDVVTDNEEGGTHKLDTDWYLELKPQSGEGTVRRRRMRVSLQLEQKRGKWRITVIQPEAIVSPVD